MPNYCFNQFMVFHADTDKMKLFAHAMETSTLFQTFIPIPDDCEQDCAIREWGTKWEIQDGFFELMPGGHNGFGEFSTAWHPPIAAFEKLKAQGFIIYAAFDEPNEGFCGRWEDGAHEYYIYEEENEFCSPSADRSFDDGG